MLEAARKQVKPSGCGCGTSAEKPRQPVYVVGSLGFDFRTEARRDALFAMNGGAPILSNAALSTFLNINPVEAASILWTLSNDQHPVYALKPPNAYGADGYQILRDILAEGVDRISVPGWIAGQARLTNGWVVPVIEPEMRGIRKWSTTSVANQIAQAGGLIDVNAPQPIALPNTTNLTSLGTTDWAYWGHSVALSFDHKATGQTKIINWTATGTGSSTQVLVSAQHVFTWTDGTPTGSASATNAVAFTTVGDGFQFTVPADPDTHMLHLYIAVTNAVGNLNVSLTDGSADPVSVDISGTGPQLVKIEFRSASATTLKVKWTMKSSGGAGSQVVLQAAALQKTGTSGLNTSQSDLQNFLDRIYFELRNKGVSPQERASNFAATQAYFVNNVVAFAIGHGLNLQSSNVAHSPLCREGSECWDVTLTFFDPQNPTTAALKVFRFTIDVSDVRPVMIGPMYRWNSY